MARWAEVDGRTGGERGDVGMGLEVEWTTLCSGRGEDR